MSSNGWWFLTMTSNVISKIYWEGLTLPACSIQNDSKQCLPLGFWINILRSITFNRNNNQLIIEFSRFFSFESKKLRKKLIIIYVHKMFFNENCYRAHIFEFLYIWSDIHKIKLYCPNTNCTGHTQQLIPQISIG